MVEGTLPFTNEDRTWPPLASSELETRKQQLNSKTYYEDDHENHPLSANDSPTADSGTCRLRGGSERVPLPRLHPGSCNHRRPVPQIVCGWERVWKRYPSGSLYGDL